MFSEVRLIPETKVNLFFFLFLQFSYAPEFMSFLYWALHESMNVSNHLEGFLDLHLSILFIFLYGHGTIYTHTHSNKKKKRMFDEFEIPSSHTKWTRGFFIHLHIFLSSWKVKEMALEQLNDMSKEDECK